jgi:peptidoglycan hydrolase CwlO-like protein
MSSDEPTRRLPPTEAGAYTGADELMFRQEVRDRLRTLATSVALLAVLAALALGVAIWALLSSDDGGDTRAASVSRVRALEDHVDQLDADLQNAAPKNGVQRLDRRIRELAGKVEDVDGRVARTTGDLDTATQDIDALREEVEDLRQRLDAIEQGAAPAPPP